MTVQLAYEEHGQGKPLVLVHGFPLGRATWHPLLPFLKNKARVILPDLRGFGQSPAGEGAAPMLTMAGDLLALLDRLNIEKATLVGHSMGGYVVLAFAHHHPERLAGLGLVTTQALADAPERKQARYQAAEDVAKNGIAPLVTSQPEKLTNRPKLYPAIQAVIKQASPQGVINALKGMAERPDATPWLAEIKQPALVISGSADTLIPPERSAQMAALLPNARLLNLPNAAHMAMMEEPEAVGKALVELVGRG